MKNPQKAAVVGHPIGHTMSPFIHHRLFSLAGIPADYSVLDIPELSAGISSLRRLNCFNVTIPHKMAIIPYLDALDEKAERFGSVNTVKVEDGILTGYTTDGPGCYLALREHGLDFSGNVLLLGNGGAARAVAFEIVSRQPGFRLTIACRAVSREKAEGLAEELSAYAESLGDRAFRVGVKTYEELEADAARPSEGPGFDLLLNTTSVGMYPHTESSPVTGQVVSRCKAVFDAVYNPTETLLLRMAEKLGIQAVGGMEMLVYQAVAAHEIWYGSQFQKEDIKELCRDAEREMARLFEQRGETI